MRGENLDNTRDISMNSQISHIIQHSTLHVLAPLEDASADGTWWFVLCQPS